MMDLTKYTFLLVVIALFDEIRGRSVLVDKLDVVSGNDGGKHLEDVHVAGLPDQVEQSDNVGGSVPKSASDIQTDAHVNGVDSVNHDENGHDSLQELAIKIPDVAPPREIVLTSLERSDFEHLSEKQFQHIREMELLLKESPPAMGLPVFEPDNIMSLEYDEEFHTISLPSHFDAYDLNKDGRISLEELIETTGAMENVDQAFAASDVDGDGHLNHAEFSMAPWLIPDSGEVKPTEQLT